MPNRADILAPSAEPFPARPPLQLQGGGRLTSTGSVDEAFAVTDLAERDQFLVRHLYEVLAELCLEIGDASGDETRKWCAIADWTERHNLNALIDDVRELGSASHEQFPSERLSRAMHDVRGGAVSSLLGRLQIVHLLPHNRNNLQANFALARDHLQLMRSALIGLDQKRPLQSWFNPSAASIEK